MSDDVLRTTVRPPNSGREHRRWSAVEIVTEEPQQADTGARWFMLTDPRWVPGAEDEAPPIEAVVGLWPFENGKVGKFRSNPDYRPVDEESPTDLVDAVLRLVVQNRAEARHIQVVL